MRMNKDFQDIAKLLGGPLCIWREGATDGVWKSTCSMVPFVESAPRGEHCPYCGGELTVRRNAHTQEGQSK